MTVFLVPSFACSKNEVQNGDVEEPRLHEEQDVEDAPGAAVAIDERMDGLELVVHDGKTHEGIKVGLLVDELPEVREKVTEKDLTFRWRGDNLAIGARELGARDATDTEVAALEDAHQLFREGRGDGTALDERRQLPVPDDEVAAWGK